MNLSFEEIIEDEKLANKTSANNITDAREKDIQALCAGVLNVTPNYYDNPNGANETTCPFCLEHVFEFGYNRTPMSEIKHSPDCPYLIAKDLSTNL